MSCDQPPVSAISRDSASAWTLSAPDDSKYVLPAYQSTTVQILTTLRQRDIARDAYRDAIEYLEQEVAHSSRWPLLSSIEDIFALIRETKASYELRKEKRGTLKWLSRLSGTVMHYSQVMDMLSQQHPEYVALIWGSMKFVLMVTHPLFHSLESF
jgi:hypothetical protein